MFIKTDKQELKREKEKFKTGYYRLMKDFNCKGGVMTRGTIVFAEPCTEFGYHTFEYIPDMITITDKDGHEADIYITEDAQFLKKDAAIEELEEEYAKVSKSVSKGRASKAEHICYGIGLGGLIAGIIFLLLTAIIPNGTFKMVSAIFTIAAIMMAGICVLFETVFGKKHNNERDANLDPIIDKIFALEGSIPVPMAEQKRIEAKAEDKVPGIFSTVKESFHGLTLERTVKNK